MTRTFFIAGTDTDVGKTLVSCALLQAAQQQGLSALGLKPVASGCQSTAAGLHNPDALLLQESSSIKLPYAQVNPYAFAQAIAPHVAAAAAGINISLAQLKGWLEQAQRYQPDVLLIEGAGGWLTPISAQYSLADFAVQMQLPVILVVGMRLGCINHALLSAQAIRQAGLPLAGWIANDCVPKMSCRQDSLEYLQQHLGAPCLAQIPFLETASTEQAASYCSDWLNKITKVQVNDS